MLSVHTSNDPERLVDALVDELRDVEDFGAWGLLHSAQLIVPSAALRRWLGLAVARRFGVSANLGATYLDRLVAEGLDPDELVLGPEELTLLVAAELVPERLADPELVPLRRYLALDRDPPASAAEVERRRVQLASRVAKRLLDLDRERPRLTKAWEGGDPAPAQLVPSEAAQAKAEPWLRILWLRLFGPEGAIAQVRAESERVALRPSETLERLPGSDEPLHVFGLLPLGQHDRALLLRLARQREVHLYSLAPAAVFHEDLPEAERAVVARLAERAEGASPAEAPLLELWEGAGRRQLLGWEAACRAAQVELRWRPRFAAPEAETLLASLQRDLLARAPSATEPAEPDRSLEVLACATPQREVEAVAERIWELVGAEEGLRFDEVALVLPRRERETYASHVLSVFREAGDLPVSLQGLAPPGASRLREGAELLIGLPQAGDTRDELLRVLLHPNLQAGLPEAEPARWLDACERLGILRGLDREDHAGTYVTQDLYSWDQGARRLGLGTFAPGGDEAPFVELGDGDYLPADLEGDELEQAGLLVTLVRSLIADLRYARGQRLPLSEWARFLHALVDSYLRPAGEDEEQLYGRLLGELRSLEACDLTGEPVSYALALSLAQSRLSGLELISRPLQEGVTVTTLERARLIPYRTVFVLGLGERGFPASEHRDVLDLRQAARLPGDLDPGERDRFLFLELLATTRERLTLSYVARDPLSGDDLLPSPVIRELFGAMSRAGALSEPPVRRERLRRYDASYLPAPLGSGQGGAVLRETWEEARSAALRGDLQRAAGALIPRGRERLLALDPEVRAPLREHLRLTPPARAEGFREGERVRVSIGSLRKFLECPLQAWAKYRLGLRESDERDPLVHTDEPFVPDRLTESNALRVAFWAALRRSREEGGEPGQLLAEAYAEVARRAELRAEFPTGLFREVLERRHRAQLETWWHVASTRLKERLPQVEPAHFGVGDGTQGHALPALALPVNLSTPAGQVSLVAEVVGTTQRRIPADGGFLHVVTGGMADHHYVHAFLDHALLAAAGEWQSDQPFEIDVCPKERILLATNNVKVQPLTQGEAQDYLRALLSDFLGGPHEVFFPLDATLPFLREQSGEDEPDADPEGALQEELERTRDAFGSIRSDWGPARGARQTPTPRSSYSLATRRLGPFVERSEWIQKKKGRKRK